jgi:hypothetical protein
MIIPELAQGVCAVMHIATAKDGDVSSLRRSSDVFALGQAPEGAQPTEQDPKPTEQAATNNHRL